MIQHDTAEKDPKLAAKLPFGVSFHRLHRVLVAIVEGVPDIPGSPGDISCVSENVLDSVKLLFMSENILLAFIEHKKYWNIKFKNLSSPSSLSSPQPPSSYKAMPFIPFSPLAMPH